MNGSTDDKLNIDELLHPANAFARPCDVLNDPDLTVAEKRAILASWASDACAIEAAPNLRAGPRGLPVRFDEIMDALRTLDREVSGHRYRRILHRRRIFQKGRGNGDSNVGRSLQ